MKSVLTSIQPYWVFLIIARIMGWVIPQEKKVEVRKDFPKDKDWNRKVVIYCTKSRRSFNRIPAQYQPFMKNLLGKVIGEFVCDSIREGRADTLYQAHAHNNPDETCLTDQEIVLYANYGNPLYFWHISDLKIYDKPKELVEVFKPCDGCSKQGTERCTEEISPCRATVITRPPQSWCYVEG